MFDGLSKAVGTEVHGAKMLNVKQNEIRALIALAGVGQDEQKALELEEIEGLRLVEKLR